eukprot:4362328-Amphidinium_carterae.1
MDQAMCACSSWTMQPWTSTKGQVGPGRRVQMATEAPSLWPSCPEVPAEPHTKHMQDARVVVTLEAQLPAECSFGEQTLPKKTRHRSILIDH